MDTYYWNEISDIPQEPGIYAWYYSPEITLFDLKSVVKKIHKCKNINDKNSAMNLIESFLDKYIFNYFQEEPYKAFIEGSLKPRYEGNLEHKPVISESLISRIYEEPERLETIKNIVELSAPNFASPMYIGMSNKLGKRLKQHKKLIEKYRTNPSSKNSINKEEIDHSFAIEISRRKILPDRLFVIINLIQDDGKRYIDLENILNRIHYPLLGRN